MASLTLAAIAPWYGASSMLRSWLSGTFRVTGRSSVFWDLVAAPRPGKCLTVAATPLACIAVRNSRPSFDTTPGLLLNDRPNSSMKLPGVRYTSRTGARLTLTPRPCMNVPVRVPSLVAVRCGVADSPICLAESPGGPSRRRTRPPSWSVISSSGSLTGLVVAAFAVCSCLTTAAMCAFEPTLSLKKITPATRPWLIAHSSSPGGVSPE